MSSEFAQQCKGKMCAATEPPDLVAHNFLKIACSAATSLFCVREAQRRSVQLKVRWLVFHELTWKLCGVYPGPFNWFKLGHGKAKSTLQRLAPGLQEAELGCINKEE